MSNQRKDNEMLERLRDALVQEILEATDAEILKEVEEDHRSIVGEADKVRALFEQAQKLVAKKRLTAAKEAIAQEKELGRKIIDISPAVARRKLAAILNGHPEVTKEFTLAARKGKDLSDSDVLGMLEDLQELGLYHPEDDSEEEP